MPSSPRPFRKGSSCCTFREGTPRERKWTRRSILGSRTKTARFHVGPVAMEHDVEHSNALLCSDGVLHFLQERGYRKRCDHFTCPPDGGAEDDQVRPQYFGTAGFLVL
ncbi:85 kDa surface glycoprotein [Trypanosoma cruzi]|nr:85 kDa surface glycoprotein [Trypanosoma cruzi]